MFAGRPCSFPIAALSAVLVTAFAPARADAPRDAPARWLAIEIRDATTRSPEVLAVPLDPGGARAVVEARSGAIATSAGVELTPSGRANVVVWRTRTSEGATAVVLHVESAVALGAGETTIAQHRDLDGHVLSVVVRAM